MKSVEIKKNIHWVGSLDPDLRVFDIIMYTPFGTTYNSYVVKGSEKTALFETVKEKTFNQYMERLNHLGIDLENIDYIIVDHTEPDHAGSVAKLIEIAPHVKIVGSATAIQFLKSIVNKPFSYITVKDGDTLSLGDKTLQFISAPFLHWPDSIYTYVQEDKVLMTCDSFGSHYCCDGIFNDKIESEKDYIEALEYYFNMIMGPFKKYVLKAIDKIKDLSIDIICPGHGPVLRDNPQKIVNIYNQWSQGYALDNKIPKITLCYVSAYGYTGEMADKIIEGIKSTGNYDITSYNVIQHDMGEIMNSINNSDALLFGSPTINGDALKPIWDILINLNPIVHGGKLAGAFGSYGWSGEGVPNIMDRLKQVRLNLTESLVFNFRPSNDELHEAFTYGINFGNRLKETVEPKDSSKKKRYWKCIVCNEVFEGDTPPDICPACGATSEQFVEVKEEKIDFNSTEHEDILIIGNGAAGFYAADAARKRNSNCSITMITADDSLSYYRPLLSEGITTSLKDEEFYLQTEDWYKENNIKLRTNSFVSSIDSDNKELTINNSEKLSYSKLILANGSKNFVPSTPGIDKDGVFTLKDLNDMDKIKAYLKDSKNIFIIGGGLTGLESAWALKQSGYYVSVAELSSKLLCSQLDNDTSRMLSEIVHDSNVNLFLENTVKEIIGDSKVEAVKLSNGKVVPTDMVIFSIGIRPNINLVKDTPIKVNRGVIVDSSMRTSFEDIFACGDVAEVGGVVYGNWQAAIEMGKTAGANAVGDSLLFEDFIPSTSFNAFNTSLFSTGVICGENVTEVALNNKSENIMKKLFFRDDTLVGGILFGDISKSVPLSLGIEKRITLSDCLKENLL